MTNTIQEQIAVLIEQYGKGEVQAAATTMLENLAPIIPANFVPVIAPDRLADTVTQLDAAASDIIEKAKGREAVYGDKLSLLKRKTELETEIELKEAGAIMEIRGEARSQYAMVGGEKVTLSNEEARKAYAKMAAKEERKKLAEVEAELRQLEVQAFWAKDEYEAAVKAGDQVQAKAHVQAGLLNLLGNRK